MPEEPIPTVPITSPLQILTLPLTLLQQAQLGMAMDMIRAMGGTAEEKTVEAAPAVTRTVEAAPAVTRTVEPDQMLIRNGILIRSSEKIIDEEVPGHLDEVTIKSTSNFSIELSIDDKLLLHESMTELIDMSNDMVSIVAIYSGGYYRFSTTDLTYNRLFLRVFLSGSGTFDIFYKLWRDTHAD